MSLWQLWLLPALLGAALVFTTTMHAAARQDSATPRSPTASPPAGDSESAARLRALFDERFEWAAREFPEQAMRRGDYRRAGQITDASQAAVDRRNADTQRCLDQLHAIERGRLGGPDQVNYDLFERELAVALESHRFREFLMPIHGRAGPQQEHPQMHVWSRFHDFDDYGNYLTRLERVPADIDAHIELLTVGMKEGRTPPQVAVHSVPEQIDALLAGGLDALAEPLAKFPDSLDSAFRDDIKTRFETRSLPMLREAFAKLGKFVRDEYLPHCRTSIACADLPDGAALYAFALRTMTTTSLTGPQIHELGLREVARIRSEMLEVIRGSDFMSKTPDAVGWDDETLFRRFVEYLRSDPRFYHTSGEALLAEYRDICKRVDAELPRFFGVLPRLPYGVRPIPAFMAPHQTTAYYSQGDIRNAQPGYFDANTYALDQRPRYEMVALAMHEAVPGHHLQIAIAQELQDVPEFRKELWIPAYGEGWALYSERLGLECGLYADPYANFGRLLYEMWRACRLVVDPGMHALGWSRDRAVQFMLDNTALSELNINNEIDRYIAWPGQACAYKLGELKIRELRQRAAEKLGSRFDLRAFHDVVLGAGTIPLDLLEQRVEAWMQGATEGGK